MSVSKQDVAAELGEHLKACRTAAGLTLRELRDLVDISNTRLSFWENGRRLPSEADLIRVLEALHVGDEERDRLIALRRTAEGPGELLSGATTIGWQLSRLIQHETTARKITDVAPLLVPGLLQTDSYAEAILGRYDDWAVRVRLRSGRQKILTGADPVQFHALISHDVFGHHIGGPDVMAEQMRHLLTVAELPNVIIQLVDTTDSGYTPMLAGPFILLEFDSAPSVVHLEHHRASASLWEEEDVRSYLAAVEEIAEAAMTPERTSEVIEELLDGMEKTR